MKNEPFVIERTFNASADRIWKAISDKNQMKQWYFDIAKFKPEVGNEFEFEGNTPDGTCYLHKCKVVEVVIGKKLKYSWRYEGFEGISFVTFELFPEGDKTRLKLTHEGLETFPANKPDFAKENFVGGWTALIGTSLKEFLEKTLSEKSA
jgi:uncharacterized protein YndB with AHSA1/START domain